MHSRDLLGFSLEAGLVDGNQSRWAELFDARGEKTLVTGASRFLPKSLLRRLVEVIREDTLPFRLGLLETEPFASGCETIVYRQTLPSGGSNVIKLRHTGQTQTTAETTQRYTEGQAVYTKYFGDMVVPNQHVIYQSPFGTKRPVIATVQPEIKGQWLFDDLSAANPHQLRSLYDATLRMIEETANQGPDFEGVNNVIVTSEGDIKIVDTGALIPMDSPRVAHWTAVRIDEIGSYIQNDIDVHATAIDMGYTCLLGEPAEVEAVL